jgi:hypothetical protein
MNAQAMIEHRKKADNVYRQMDSMIAEEKKIIQRSHFESTTGAKIEKRIKQNEMDQYHRDNAIGLLQKRQLLADLYNNEAEEWRVELMNRVETQEDRKARIMERAYLLRDKRENAKKESVQRSLDAQWRDACDDARTLDSKAMTQFVAQERQKQIADKVVRDAALNGDENSFLVEWKIQLDAVEAKDKAKTTFRHDSDMAMYKGIEEQMKQNEFNKRAHYKKQSEEDAEEIQRIKEAIAFEDNKQKARQDLAHARGREILAYNSQFKEIEEEEARQSREQDAILLDYALRKEREQLAFEQAKKDANKNAAMQFRKYLEEQMLKGEEETKYVDAINKAEEEKVWKARDDALQAREDARSSLLKQVTDGRALQIRSKGESLIKERDADKIFASKFIEDAKEGVELEKNATMLRRTKANENNVKLQSQIQSRIDQEELARQEIYLENKHMKHVERAHQNKLAEQGGAIRMFRPLKESKWYS